MVLNPSSRGSATPGFSKFLAVLTCVFLLGLLPAGAKAASPDAKLQEMIARLKTHPGDDALRANLIRYARRIEPALTLPEEALRYKRQGEVLLEIAKTFRDYSKAAQELEKTLALAPWSAPIYLELADAYEKAGNHGQVEFASGSGRNADLVEEAWWQAADDLKWYLLAGGAAEKDLAVRRRRMELLKKVFKWQRSRDLCGGCKRSSPSGNSMHRAREGNGRDPGGGF